MKGVIVFRNPTKIKITTIIDIANYSCTGLKHPELESLYTESGQKVENRIKMLHVALIIVTPVLCICPAVTVNFITHFTTNAAFELPLPMW